MTTIKTKAKVLQKNLEQIVHQFKAVAGESLGSNENLKPKEMNTIIYIGESCGCIMRDITAFLDVADSTVTLLVDKLTKLKLVKREYSEEDRRIIKIVLTGEGKAVYKKHLDAYHQFCVGILKTLDEKEQDLYVELIEKIANGAKENFAKG